MSQITFGQIVQIVRSRQQSQSQLLQQMIEVRRRYNAEWVMPVPTDHDAPDLAPVTATIISEAIDFQANQASGPTPVARFPAQEWSDRAVEYAMRRRRACGAVMTASGGKLWMRRAYRHLAGYATASQLVIPDFELGMPRIVLRDPLTTYPEPKAPEDLTPLRNCAYVFPLSAEGVRELYPASRAEYGGPIAADAQSRDYWNSWDIVEWVDDEVTVTGILGPHDWTQHSSSPAEAAGAGNLWCELSRIPQRTGACPAVTPQRVTLDKIASQIAHITGHVDLLARLTTLNIMATEKSIFKDKYVIGKEGQTPKLVNGTWKDGRTGEMNLVQDATAIGELTSTPDPNNRATIDTIERNARVSVGLIPQAGGENSGSLRTGRANDSMLAISVDPRTRELQEIMEPAMTALNEHVLRHFKAYWPSKKYEDMFSGWAGDYTTFEFVPEKHITSFANIVKYPFGGADEQGTTIILGQLHGQQAISLKTLRERHPWIDDPDSEGKRVDMELLEQAIMQSLQQGAAGGTLPPTYIAKVLEHRAKEPNLIKAIEKAEADIKAEQAAAPPPPGPGQIAAPEAMPGLAGPESVPGMQAAMPPGGQLPPEAMAGAIGPNADQQGLKHLMSALATAPAREGPTNGEQVAV